MKNYWSGFVFIVLAAGVALSMSGCSQEFYLGTRRIDRYEQKQEMTEKPAYCHFFNCSTGGSSNEK